MMPSETMSTWDWLSFSNILLPLLFFLPFFVMANFAVALLRSGDVDPKDIGKAVYFYVLLGVGVMLILLGTFPLFLSLFGAERLPARSYGALIVFIVGGGSLIQLLARRMCHLLQAKVAAVPRAVFYCTFYVAGALLSIVGFLMLLSGGLDVLLGEETYQPVRFWVLPLSLLCTGGGLLLGLRLANEGKFQYLCPLPRNDFSGKMSQPSTSKRLRSHG